MLRLFSLGRAQRQSEAIRVSRKRQREKRTSGKFLGAQRYLRNRHGFKLADDNANDLNRLGPD